MIRVLTVLCLFMVFMTNKGYACDACACSIGSNGIGLLANYRNNFRQKWVLDTGL